MELLILTVLVALVIVEVEVLRRRIKRLENLPSIKDHLKYAKKNKK